LFAISCFLQLAFIYWYNTYLFLLLIIFIVKNIVHYYRHRKIRNLSWSNYASISSLHSTECNAFLCHIQVLKFQLAARTSVVNFQVFKYAGQKLESSLMMILDIGKDFLNHLGSLVPRLFDRNNLVVKRINGQPVTCSQLLTYINVNCLHIFNLLNRSLLSY